MKKSLARLDLNLLLTLHTLLSEQSVTKAAKRLNVTPSTVSKSLTKLRQWFNDPLFIKSPSGFIPTPLAHSLSQELSDWFQIGRQIAERRSEDITPGMRFDLVLESPHFLTLFETLASKIYQQFPQAKIKTRQWDYDSLDAIVKGEVDIGLTGRENHPRSKESLNNLPYFIDHEILFTEMPVVFIHKDHPALNQPWDLTTFLRYAHINTLWEKGEFWALDQVMHELGLERRIDLVLSSFEQALYIAAQPRLGLLTTAPGYCRHYVQQVHPDLVERPIPVPDAFFDKLAIPFAMIWHKRNAHNPKLIWLRDTIKQIYQQTT
ncbi:HTH-type transcriptional regulator YidZ [Vibrio sp. SM6]|uniref:HTH-type transcriptional regulator YidZ n=1 Tax=Vibrio agarilyticus TaxID=2726741 RepID=A0A7X8YG39_9VIBR|nr:HTH-type transcriptional regulator YidZ [Vibrio agarilyticus]NLS12175.1 HTH-type transcriptional regulator YidZ [Vibrio agarilyticus]